MIPVATVRTGACTPGCGACCQWIELQVAARYARNPDTRKWLKLHGIEITQDDNLAFATIPLPCRALLPDGRCSLYGTPDRPDLCGRYPATPADLSGLEGVCTFGFAVSPSMGSGAEME